MAETVSRLRAGGRGRRGRWLILTAALLAPGCNDLGSFDTGEGEAYCGQITLAGDYRLGFSPRVQMRLHFSYSQIELGASPGAITTIDSGIEAEEDRRLLSEAPLRPIPPLAHDPLSELEFGDGREKSFIFAVTPADPQAESLLAVVSLRSDEAVEVRLIRPGVAGQAPAGREPLFGLFVLQRQEGDCGF